MSLAVVLRIVLLGSLWGPSFLFIKIGLTELPPLTLCTCRFIVAGALLLAFVLYRKIPLKLDKQLMMHMAVMSILATALPMTLINMSEQYIDSSLAGIINGMSPILTVLLAHYLLPNEHITRYKIAGIALGMSGFLFIFLPIVMHPDYKIALSAFGVFGVGMASCSYAAGFIYGKRYLQCKPTLAMPVVQMAYSTLYCGVLSMFFEHPWTLNMPTTPVILAVGSLALFGTAIAYVGYYYVLDKDGPVALSMTAYLLPIYAMILGHAFLGEPLPWTVLIAAICIIAGLLMVNKQTISKTVSSSPLCQT